MTEGNESDRGDERGVGGHCEHCDRTVSREDAIRRKTYGDLDPEKWQVLCCPDCGRRLETVFVALADEHEHE